MKNLKKVFPYITILFLIVLIVLGYQFTQRKSKYTPGKIVPVHAQAVLYTSPQAILKDFYHLLKHNPTLLDSIVDTKIDLKEIQKNAKGNGINPLEDIVLYQYKDKNEPVIGIILDVFNPTQFYNFISPKGYMQTEYKEGEILLFPNGSAVLKQDKKTVLLKYLNPDAKFNKENAQEQFDAIFSSSERLVDVSSNFNEFIQAHKHIGIWVSKNNKEITDIGDVFHILNNFGDKAVNLTAKKKNIEINASLELLDQNFFVSTNKKTVKLSTHEIAKLSLTTTPKYAYNIISQSVPSSLNYIENYCSGEICLAFIGYRTTPVYTTKIVEKIDSKTFHTVKELDTVEFSPLVNVPELMGVAKIKQAKKLIEKLQQDTSIIKENDYYKIPHPVFVSDYIYLKVNNELLFVGTCLKFNDILPEFTTFSFCYHVHKSIAKYPPKNAVQKMGLLALPEVPISAVNIYYDTITPTALKLKGDINFTQNKHHSILQLTGEILKYRGFLKGFF